MRRGMGISVVLAILAAGPSVAWTQVTLVNQQRGVTVYPPATSVIAPDFGPFNETVATGPTDEYATAIQESTISPSLFAGVLAARDLGFGLNWSANSYYQVVFEVTAPLPYDVSGTAQIPFNSSPPASFAGLKLTGPSNTPVFDYGMWEYGWLPEPGRVLDFSTTGILMPGTYTLLGRAYSAMPPETPVAGYGQADLSFAMTILPEPTALLLVGCCASALIGRRADRRIPYTSSR